MLFEASIDNFFDYLGDERQVRHRSIIVQYIWIGVDGSLSIVLITSDSVIALNVKLYVQGVFR